jgi:hypothetical protein
MKIKILHPIPGYAYFGGEIAEIPDDLASKWIVSGKALMIPDTLTKIEPIQAIIRQEEVINKTIPKKKK